MLIMRFHKLIQSKVVWIVFLGIVVVSFVALQVASDTARDPAVARLGEPVATIAGEDVSFLRFDATRRLIGSQSPSTIDPEMLEDLVFNHLAMVAYAESLGIQVETEFAARQFARNFTDESGNLDPTALENFRLSIRGSNLTEADYIAFIREQMVVDQLRQQMAGAILVSDFDAERWAGLQTDEFVMQYAPLGPEILEEEVAATDGQVAAFFEENPARFTLPEERVVRYLSIDVEPFLEKTELPGEEEARALYNAEPDRFTRTIDVPAEGDDPATTRNEPVPFEEVQEELREELRAAQAAKQAEELAMSLAVRMTPRRGRAPEAMDALAEELGQEARTSPAFARYTRDIPELNDAFREEAFKLDETEYGRRGGPVEVDGAYVVLELAEIIPPRVPELEDVVDRVKPAANRAEMRKALAAEAEVLAEGIRQAIEEGASFETAAKARELNVLTSDPVSMMNLDPRRSMIPQEILREAAAHLPGELIGPVQSRFGGFFLATVKERTPQPVAREELLPQMRSMLANQLQFQGMFSRFQEEVIQPTIEKL